MKLCKKCKPEIQKIFDALDEEERSALIKALEKLQSK